MDHWAFIAQLLCRVDGQFNGFRGAVSEQFYWSNWSSWGQDTTDIEPDGIKGGCGWRPPDHHHQKGHFEGFSALWCINLMIVGARMFLDLQDEL